MKFTKQLADEYQRLYDTAAVTRLKATGQKIVNIVLANKARYEKVAAATGVPWQAIAIIHAMECSCNFKLHLHNGDPLTARTTRVPKGRPKTGTPPFTWEESAIDALADRATKDLTIPRLLYMLESYNGWGYRNKGINSPYLWSGTQHYTKGKYVRDGAGGFDPNFVSKQPGAVLLLKLLGGFSCEDSKSGASGTKS
jgi:lysozyme family protein